MKSTLDSFSITVGDVLKQYGDNVEESLEDIIKDVANMAKKELRKTSPRRTGKYSRSWRTQSTGSRINPEYTVYNELPGLTHLLEYGHATRNGGRTREFPHLYPVMKEIPEMIIERLAKRV